VLGELVTVMAYLTAGPEQPSRSGATLQIS
jgi:hypothetical protein